MRAAPLALVPGTYALIVFAMLQDKAIQLQHPTANIPRLVGPKQVETMLAFLYTTVSALIALAYKDMIASERSGQRSRWTNAFLIFIWLIFLTSVTYFGYALYRVVQAST